MVLGMMRPDTIILLFALITGLTIWEYCGLVNNVEGVRVNQPISTIAGVYLVIAVAGWRVGFVDFRAFVPYILTIVYMFIEELYLKQKNPLNDLAYTMLGQMYVAMPFAMIFFFSFFPAPIHFFIALVFFDIRINHEHEESTSAQRKQAVQTLQNQPH